MEIFFQILFWSSIFALLHSYVFFPLILKILRGNKSINCKVYSFTDDLPKVSILMAVFNEEEVISEKLTSVYNSDYPSDKLEIIIGSDHSTDNSNSIINDFSLLHSNLLFYIFEDRQGKPSIINQLQNKATGDILIITDANVFFDKNTIFELVKHFKNKEIGLTDSRLINKKESITKRGISYPENKYILRETEIKQNESIIWGTMMGPSGACYAIRNELYSKVPSNYLVDDFYINMNVLAKNKKTISSIDACVFEDVSDDIKEEFRRKVRISTGNFQNLKSFYMILFSGIKGLSFSFISHKILRWFGPFFLITALGSSLFLFNIQIYKYLSIIFMITLIIPVFDLIIRKFKINLSLPRFISHFYLMNLALLIGFFKFIFGVKKGIWQPTKRNQSKLINS